MNSAQMACDVAVIGGGPAGLAAAETACAAGARVAVFDAMPSLGRKLLMAGKSGLNLTHAEPYAGFAARYREAAPFLRPMLDAFPPEALRAWCDGLGIETFTGSSGRVFPVAMKASPLLRAWLARLAAAGVTFHPRHRFEGWDGEALRFSTLQGERLVEAGACVLAMGGASWPRLGSDGTWAALFATEALAPLNTEALAPLTPAALEPFAPSNAGIEIGWSVPFVERFAGEPVKAVRLRVGDQVLQGEFVITRRGAEGSAIYALGPAIRAQAAPELILDLAPDRSLEAVRTALERAPTRLSQSNRLRRALRLEGVKAGLLREAGPLPDTPAALAARIKALGLAIDGLAGIERAISTAGGLRLDQLDERLMLRARPGVFAAGEMLDWDAPTGGYLLTACLATGRWAGCWAGRWAGRWAAAYATS
ncbi:MAG: TIGR03862 family flavoprotein [Neomegalonema sp.]|nr:TIGR03862 family flavoprotein [Neomegalonema sp.]